MTRAISIPPSGIWEGNDGLWSTVNLALGTPGQHVRLLPGTSATSSTSIWTVLDEGCSLANPNMTDCAKLRGETFSRNSSDTWSTNRLANGGLYGLLMLSESALGLEGNAYFGFDTIGLNASESQSIGLDNQLIAGYATNDFWLGLFPLSPIAMNFTNMDQSVPSLLANLADEGHIPSRSWAYSAGAHYTDPPKFASLTLGGYDSQMIRGPSLQVPFGADQSRDLVLWLDSITYDTYGSSPLMSQGVYVFIDSLVPHLWLPVEVCRQFEEAFKLVWDKDEELYLVNETAHAALVLQNPTFTLSLRASEDTADSITIDMPYAAFDLNVSAPIVTSTTRYFPLKRAMNETQYVLGRSFLQEAYIIADYERKNFTVSQVAVPQDGAQSHLVNIVSPDKASNTTGAVSLPDSTGRIVSGGAIAGVTIGVIVLIASLVILFLWFRKHRKPADATQKDWPPSEGKQSMEKGCNHLPIHEMAVKENTVHEADARFGAVPELQDSYSTLSRQELSGVGIVLEADTKMVHELPGR